jgi:hypothetical protein
MVLSNGKRTADIAYDMAKREIDQFEAMLNRSRGSSTENARSTATRDQSSSTSKQYEVASES